jgi:hypothetical protein
MLNHYDTEMLIIPNVKYVVDGKGKGWYCNPPVIKEGDLRAQGCVPAEDWDYDRMFGG